MEPYYEVFTLVHGLLPAWGYLIIIFCIICTWAFVLKNTKFKIYFAMTVT